MSSVSLILSARLGNWNCPHFTDKKMEIHGAGRRSPVVCDHGSSVFRARGRGGLSVETRMVFKQSVS